MRQPLSIVLIVIAAILVVGVKMVAPKPGSLRIVFRMSCCHSDVRSWCDMFASLQKADIRLCDQGVR